MRIALDRHALHVVVGEEALGRIVGDREEHELRGAARADGGDDFVVVGGGAAAHVEAGGIERDLHAEAGVGAPPLALDHGRQPQAQVELRLHAGRTPRFPLLVDHAIVDGARGGIELDHARVAAAHGAIAGDTAPFAHRADRAGLHLHAGHAAHRLGERPVYRAPPGVGGGQVGGHEDALLHGHRVDCLRGRGARARHDQRRSTAASTAIRAGRGVACGMLITAPWRGGPGRPASRARW